MPSFHTPRLDEVSEIYQETSSEEEGGEPSLISSSAYMRPKTKGRGSEFSQALSALVILGLFRVRDVISECLPSREDMRRVFSRFAVLLNETYSQIFEGKLTVSLEGYAVIHSGECVRVGLTLIQQTLTSTSERRRLFLPSSESFF